MLYLPIFAHAWTNSRPLIMFEVSLTRFHNRIDKVFNNKKLSKLIAMPPPGF